MNKKKPTALHDIINQNNELLVVVCGQLNDWKKVRHHIWRANVAEQFFLNIWYACYLNIRTD